MITRYGVEIKDKIVVSRLVKLTNQIYKLLPMREEGKEDWKKPLQTIIEELTGMDWLLVEEHEVLFPLLCKLSGLFSLTEEQDFFLFRRVIFECLSLMNKMRKEICQ